MTKILHHPGFEPGSTAWKAAILTTRLMMRNLKECRRLLPLIHENDLALVDKYNAVQRDQNSDSWRLHIHMLIFMRNT